ncbi:hypothetical protein BH23ACT4_BH23ACT4_16470 [soil metagenome]
MMLLLAVAACDPITVETTTTLEVLPPPDLPGPSSSTTTTGAPPVTNDPSPYHYRGFLPNGADYHASLPGSQEQTPLLIEGVFFFQGDDGLIPVGEVRYATVSEPPSSVFESQVLRVAAGPWVVDVVFLDEVLAQLGADAEEVITRSIGLEDRDGWPVLQLSSPFTWGALGSVAPSVQYESFAVAAGCTALSVTCAETRSVQIQALTDIAPGYPALSSEQRDHAWVTTSTKRYALDPNYLNPGPLDPRLSADLIWTGEEMIVWGGKQAREGLTTLVDGTAFNPDTDEWRVIAPFPLQGPQGTRAVWGDGGMIVVSGNGTFGYDPAADSWRTIGSGVVPSEWHDRIIYVDGQVYVWATATIIHELTVATGEWRQIEAPLGGGSLSDSQFRGVMRNLDDELVVVGLEGSCSGRRVFLHTEGWVELAAPDLSTESYADCSTANQTASVDGTLVAWEDEDHPAAMFANPSWTEIASIPLGGVEGASGPVSMGVTHVLVPRWGEAAIFDLTTETWHSVTLPGTGTDAEIIWTGEEFLAWGVFGTFDAWRWTPDQPLIGGDDAS